MGNNNAGKNLGLILTGPIVSVIIIYALLEILAANRKFINWLDAPWLYVVELIAILLLLVLAPPIQKYNYGIISYLWSLPILPISVGILLHRYVLIAGIPALLWFAYFFKSSYWWIMLLLCIALIVVLVKIHYKLYKYYIHYPRKIEKSKSVALTEEELMSEHKESITEWEAVAIVRDENNEYDISDTFIYHNGELIDYKSKWPKFMEKYFRADESQINDIEELKIKLESNGSEQEITISRKNGNYDTRKIVSFVKEKRILPTEVSVIQRQNVLQVVIMDFMFDKSDENLTINKKP